MSTSKGLHAGLAAVLATACVAQPLTADAAQRVTRSVRVSPKVTAAVLVKESLRHTHLSQVQAEARVIGPRAKHRAEFHVQTTNQIKPVLLGIRTGRPVTVAGAQVPTVVVSVLTYGLYESDPIAVTRQIDYTYNAQNGALVTETAVVATADAARRHGLPVITRRGAQ